ncbi:MAG: ABC transporter ATP-binding protein [Gracilibacteraceae bacterium]|jgi:iron complex transport system ATP-binding protein|nr:ABC transporter ATP-binding protein [Gracilibacteraceae bacterium]
MIEIKNISYAYGRNAILKDISFNVRNGECVGILGNNGAGKSTLITCLSKIRTPKTGSLHIDNNDVLKMSRVETARRISYVAQKNEISQITVFDSVLLGRKPYIKWAVAQEDIDICDATIEQIGMTDFKLRYVNELSGGELQKVMLSRALVQQPRLLLLDEPTSNLDPKNQYEMLALVRRLAGERNISVLMVLHDLNLALRYCDRFLFIKEGSVYKYGDESIITEEAIGAVYGIGSKITQIDGKKFVIIG